MTFLEVELDVWPLVLDDLELDRYFGGTLGRKLYTTHISPKVSVFELFKAQQMMETLNDLTNGEELDANQECTYQDEALNQMQNDYYDMNR